MSSPSAASGATGSARAQVSALVAVASIALATVAAPAFASDVDPEPSPPTSTSPAETTPATTAPTTPVEITPTETTPTTSVDTTVVAAAPPAPLLGWTDGVPPALGIVGVRRDLEDARRNGLRVTYRVAEPVTLRADVLIYGEVTDRELRMCALPAAGPGESLAKTTLPRTPLGTNVVRVPFNVPSRRTLKKFLKITVKVRLIATDRSGSETTVTKPISLRLR